MKSWNLLVTVFLCYAGYVVSQICVLSGRELKCQGLRTISSFGHHYPDVSLIDLSKNSLTFIPSVSFKDFKNAKYINLSSNGINRVEQGTFDDKAYHWIDLSHNKLTTMSRHVLPADDILMANKLIIYLHHNPWHCTCALKWLVDFIKESLVNHGQPQPKCFTPSIVNGRTLASLEDEEYCVIQECLECDDEAKCIFIGNRYTCVCRPSYTGNGHLCTDINECNELNACKANERCENFSGGYQCSCTVGFERKDGKCKDIDECNPPPKGCGIGQGRCKNTLGSYKCICNLGMEYVKGIGCTDIDECKAKNDPCKEILNSFCVNTPVLDIADEGYTCQCNDGYVMTGGACVLPDGNDSNIVILTAALCGFLLVVIVIIFAAFVYRTISKHKQEGKEKEFLMSPVAMETPMEFAFMEMPQQQVQDTEEWHDVDWEE